MAYRAAAMVTIQRGARTLLGLIRRYWIPGLGVTLLSVLIGIAVSYYFYQLGKHESTESTQQIRDHLSNFQEDYRDLFRSSFPGIYGATLEEAYAAWRQGRLNETLDFLRRAQRLANSSDEKAHVRIQLGNLYEDMGRFPDAKSEFVAASVDAEHATDRSLKASALGSIANRLREERDLAAAEQLYNQALMIQRAVADKVGEAKTLNNLGRVAEYRHDLFAALDLYQQGFDVYTSISSSGGQAKSLLAQSRVYRGSGNSRLADEKLSEAERLARLAGERRLLADIASYQAHVLRSKGEFALAEAKAKESLAIVRAMGLRYAESEVLGLLGYIARSARNFDAAIAYHQTALELKRALADRQGEAVALNDIAFVQKDLGNIEGTKTYANQAISLARKVGDKYVEGSALANLGAAEAGAGARNDSLKHQCQAWRLFQEIGASTDVAIEEHNIRLLHGGSPSVICPR